MGTTKHGFVAQNPGYRLGAAICILLYMAVIASRVTVGTSATKIAENTSSSGGGEGDYRNRLFLLKNVTASEDIFVGGDGVTTGAGFLWAVVDGGLEIELEPGESLYGIVATTGQTVHVLEQGR